MPRPRNWTDAELAEAVASARTWSDVVVKIGRADFAKARRFVQGHAVRLKLDVSHLPAFKPIDPIYPHDTRIADADLATAVSSASSWAEVLRQTGRSVSGSTQATLRRQAQEAGIDFSHFRGQAWSSAPLAGVETPFNRCRDDKYLHQAATALATAWFLGRGYMVSVPVEPTLYDLISESDQNLARVQVKSTRSQDSRGHWTVRINRMVYDGTVKPSANGARTRCNYTAEEIDYFFVVTAAGDKYLIPQSVTDGLGSLTLDSKYAAFSVT